ncbi:intracellular serine protease [Fusarium heterosporum]|uniref:Intracellular serine protease n=1 Tax=Fusarium heterosporum TaxID=42747 RepID=A0A8H5TPQ5_FUSHE|nr:intracellular serine protease [Fusarium heterosporum]
MSDAEDRDTGREFGDHEEEDSEEEESEEEDDLTRKTKSATEQMMKIFSGKLTTEQDVDKFFRDHHKVLAQEAAGHGTFLHKIIQMVYEKTIKAADVKPIITRLMEIFPDLIRIKNGDERNPLYHAIHLKKYSWKLVGYMLKSCSDPVAVADALEMPCGEERSSKTCLTLAFEKGLREDVLKSLVGHASLQALELRDSSGRTPFHYAVQYEQCSDDRVDVIKLLLSKDGDAVEKHKASGTSKPLETFLDSKYKRTEDDTEYSVYSEHKRTAKVYHQNLEESIRKEKEAKLREAEQDRGDVKVANVSVPVKEKESLKLGLEKGPKSRTAEDRDRKAKNPDRDRDTSRKEPQNADETEKRRQELKEQEREALERRAKDEKKYLKDTKGSTKQSRDPKAALNGTGFATPRGSSEHAPNTPLKRVATQNFDMNTDDEKKRKAKTTSTKRSSTKGSDSKVLARNSNKILTLLKLHYMRTRSIRKVTSFLHGKNFLQDIQIFFDYKGLPSEIKESVFNDRFGKDASSGIRFDEVLMFVRFPNVRVIREKGRKAPELSIYCRQDMEFFFNWLYTKGVRRILKVEVEESSDKPHSDQSILKSLERIVVEHLDWQKPDLDPRLICQLGNKADHPSFEDSVGSRSDGIKSDLRELTLKWSGSNAVLRGWSEPEGLPLLEKLSVVNINYPPQEELIDYNSWVVSNLDEFRSRLNRNAIANASSEKAVDVILPTLPEEGESVEANLLQNTDIKPFVSVPERKIEVTPRQSRNGAEGSPSTTGGPKGSGRINPMTEHEWLRCMEGFAGCMNSLWKKTINVSQSQPRQDLVEGGIDQRARNDLESLQKPVVVALIDDGVDSCDPAFEGRHIEGVTFDYQDSAVGQYYISGKGHGTEMAKMICKVCPMAHIYSIRLKTHSSPDQGGLTIDAISAALAIEAALEKGATIISMSWTIPVPAEGSDEKRLLDSVLERACKQKVLMFCSSSDQISDTDHYPSSFRRHRFFLIGAAHDDGSAYGHAGKNNDFIFPGVNVDTSSGRSLHLYLADKTAASEESTGSSIATALAAGLAAMITYCFKASALATVIARMQQGRDYMIRPELVKQTDVDRIAEHDVLKGAFNRIGKLENGQFIQVWDRFQPATEYLKDDLKSDEDKLEFIMNLCSNLIER